MSKDWLSTLREIDDAIRAEQSAIHQRRAARRAEIEEFWEAWNAILRACNEGDENNSNVPDLAGFIAFAKALKARGWGEWPQQMLESCSHRIGKAKDSFRPGALFVAGLLVEAGKPRANVRRLAEAYQSFTPNHAGRFWRGDGADEIQGELNRRLDEFERGERNLRIHQLKQAAARRPALKKQLFAVCLHVKGKGPAAIRDLWNRENPRDSVEPGEAGRGDIKTAIRRGQEFLRANNTTIEEIARVIELQLPQA